jgi:hypothetical protein
MPPTTPDIAHSLFRFPPPAPAISVAYYNSAAENAHAYLSAAPRSSAFFFSGEAHVRSRDVIQIHWSSPRGAEDATTDAAVSTLDLYCLVCGESRGGDAGTADSGWDACSRVTPSEQPWCHRTVLLPTQRHGLQYTVPEVGSVGMAYACAFALGGGEATSESERENVLSQAFVVNNVPRDGGVEHDDTTRFIYNATYPAGVVLNGEEHMGGWDSDYTVVDMTKGSDERRRAEPLHSKAALQEAERKRKRQKASIGIIIGAVLAAFLFAFVLWKRCPSCKQGRDVSTRPSGLERQQHAEQGPSRRDGHEDDEQDVEKPPPAYHEVVTRQQRRAARYEMQRVNAPVPDYTPSVPTTLSSPHTPSGA